MNAHRLLNLLKQFNFYESNKKIENKEQGSKNKENGGKRHVKFINQKMIVHS